MTLKTCNHFPILIFFFRQLFAIFESLFYLKYFLNCSHTIYKKNFYFFFSLGHYYYKIILKRFIAEKAEPSKLSVRSRILLSNNRIILSLSLFFSAFHRSAVQTTLESLRVFHNYRHFKFDEPNRKRLIRRD